MSIDSSAWIECQNSRWNTTGLQCLQKADLNAAQVQVKWQHIESTGPVRSVEPLVDHDALSCMDIDLDRATAEQDSESLLFSMRLDSGAHIPRVVLMVKSTEQQQHQHGPNLTLLEDLISEMNSKLVNLTTTSTESPVDAGDVEVEEAKRFLDFVYETEFRNHSAPMRMMLLGEDETSDRKHKVIRTARHEIKFSVLLASSAEVRQQSSQQMPRECYFNEDAAIAVGAGRTNVSTELLIFDCHLPPTANESVLSGDSSSSSTEEQYIWVRLDITKLNDPNRTVSSEPLARSLVQLCGLEVLSIAGGACGKPYVPIYGMVSKTVLPDNVTVVAQYGCMSGYRAINLTNNHEEQLSVIGVLPNSARQVALLRTCNARTGKWGPSSEDIFCVPVSSCRQTPPLADPKKFYFEYSKLDNLKRAISGASLATLRCQMMTDYVMPYTIYGCDKTGQWVRLGKNDTEPRCRTSLNRNSRRKPNHYYHHYYHYFKDSEPKNRTAVIIFGRQINDNKYLIYYGAAGLVLLFGGSFIILFHVRRMAKKISRQMRERSYMAAEKGVSESFLPISGMDSGLPPYYSNNGGDVNDNFYDVNTMFSNDLPPPATPISMPTSGLGKDKSNNLSSNFDSIKF